MSQLNATATARFEAALKRVGARDPRAFYRERLRELRRLDDALYEQAVDYYEKTLLRAVASEESDPIGEWLEYGRLLASLLAEGETVQIDASGRATPYQRPVPVEALVLHLPTSTRMPALAVGLPPQLSAAQRTTYELLVTQKIG